MVGSPPPEPDPELHPEAETETKRLKREMCAERKEQVIGEFYTRVTQREPGDCPQPQHVVEGLPYRWKNRRIGRRLSKRERGATFSEVLGC